MNQTHTITRRQFLQILAIGGAAGLGLKLGLDRLDVDQAASDTRLLMGTVVNIKVIDSDPVRARHALQTCFARMEELESVLSRFRPASQLSTLNRDGRLQHAHPALVDLLRQAREISVMSSGAFDITVKPLIDLYQARPGVLPAASQIQAALRLVDYRQVVTDPETAAIAFEQPGMSITLDGIAKGYIVDQGVAAFRELGFPNVLVEAGGDLMGLGEKAPRSPWQVGLQSPRAGMGEFLDSFSIRDQAIATSGDYMQSFTADFVNHHIIDPRSGHSPAQLASASVIAPSAALADGLATAVMVMGEEGVKLTEAMEGCEAYVVTKDMQVVKTRGLDA